ncbi:MAG TPA: hypothetical protein VIK45_07990 [Candidatus Dormibacteraeota bacterium]
MRLRHSREYRYPLVSVFLPFCQPHELTDLSQVNPRMLDRLTGELLENGNKHAELSRHTIGRLPSFRQRLLDVG